MSERLSARETGVLSEETVAAAVLEELSAGRIVVVCTVVATSRSVPRRPGAKMLVLADGRTLGSVGGGELEARVVADAQRSFAGESDLRTRTYDLVDAASGDAGVCGGTAEILIEPKLPKPTLLVVGCGHVGRAVCSLARWLGYRVVATDDRVELATPALVPDADLVVPGGVDEALTTASLMHTSSIVVVTRNVAVDLAALPILLASPASYVGLMGSRRRWEVTRSQLLAAGVSVADLDRVQTPIGLEIGAETPEEIAVSVMAAVVAARRVGSST
jgi:xanthine dehydrogenase accessory factor